MGTHPSGPQRIAGAGATATITEMHAASSPVFPNNGRPAWHHSGMHHQERLDARFSYAQALWLASFHIAIRRDAHSIQSQALLKTTAGTAAKTDILRLFGQPKQRRFRWKIDPAWIVAVPALLGTGAMLWMLAAIVG